MGTIDRLVTIAFLTQPLKTEEVNTDRQSSLLVLSLHRIYVVSCCNCSAVDGQTFGCHCCPEDLMHRETHKTWTCVAVQLNSATFQFSMQWLIFQNWKYNLKTFFWHCQCMDIFLLFCSRVRLDNQWQIEGEFWGIDPLICFGKVKR